MTHACLQYKDTLLKINVSNKKIIPSVLFTDKISSISRKSFIILLP